MKKFTILKEEAESLKYYKVTVTVDLYVQASDEGEAGHTFDQDLKNLETLGGYQLGDIEETTKSVYTDVMDGEKVTDSSDEVEKTNTTEESPAPERAEGEEVK
jgi:hypothetical protein